MKKDIKYKKIQTEINFDGYVSKIADLVGNIKNVTMEGTLKEKKVYEIENAFLVILNIEEQSGNISAFLVGNRNTETKEIIKNLTINENYRVQGNTVELNEEFYIEMNTFFANDTSYKNYIFGNNLLAVKAIQEINA